MLITKGDTWRITETEHGIVLHRSCDNILHGDPLFEGNNMHMCLDYCAFYTENLLAGMARREAHERALRSVKVNISSLLQPPKQPGAVQP